MGTTQLRGSFDERLISYTGDYYQQFFGKCYAHGEGELFSKLVKKVIKGKFNHGELVDGHALETWETGETYEGNFVNYKKQGPFKHNIRDILFAEVNFDGNRPSTHGVKLKVKVNLNDIFDNGQVKLETLAKFFSEPSAPYADEKHAIDLRFEGEVGINIVNDATTYHLKCGEISIFQICRINGKWRNDMPDGDFIIEDIKEQKTMFITFLDGIKKNISSRPWPAAQNTSEEGTKNSTTDTEEGAKYA